MEDFMAGLTTALDWIETNIINGLVATVFNFFKDLFLGAGDLTPFIESLNEILAIFAGA